MYTIIDIRLSFLKQNSFVRPIFKCFELPLSLTFHLPQMLDLNYQPSLSISSFEIFHFSSITQCCLTLCNPIDWGRLGFSVHHQLPEFAQTHIHWVSDAIQPSHPLSSPSRIAFNPSQHHSLFQWVSSSHQVAKVLKLQLQHQSFQWIFRTDFL